jgi:outer membrane lipoprotein SlyB
MFRSLIGLGAFVGTIVGGFVPSLWGDNSMFSAAGMLFSVVGGIAGIWAGYRLSQNLDL